MDERIGGTARNLGGKVQEGVGRVMGDTETEMRGKANQVAGAAEDLYGQAKDAAVDAAAAVRQGASDATDHVRDFITQRPYTTAAIALAIGWAVARIGRRDY